MEIRRDYYLQKLIHACGNRMINMNGEGIYIVNIFDFLRNPMQYVGE